MKNERVEDTLAWCKKNELESTRLNKFNRESKKERSKGKRPKNTYNHKRGFFDPL